MISWLYYLNLFIWIIWIKYSASFLLSDDHSLHFMMLIILPLRGGCMLPCMLLFFYRLVIGKLKRMQEHILHNHLCCSHTWEIFIGFFMLSGLYVTPCGSHWTITMQSHDFTSLRENCSWACLPQKWFQLLATSTLLVNILWGLVASPHPLL